MLNFASEKRDKLFRNFAPVNGSQMNIKRLKNWFKSLQTRSTLAIIITAAVLMEIMGIVQYWYAGNGIRAEVEHRAESELRAKSLEIRNVMVSVETATHNMKWAVEEHLSSPEAMYDMARHLVENTHMMVGCAIAFEPNFYPAKGYMYEPYAFRNEKGEMELRQISSETHNYLQSEWYRTGIEKGTGYWSEPYFDNSGARMMLCSYILPFYDATGKVAGVICSDVSLDWLSSVINARHIYPSSQNLMISRTGQLMVCPEESLVMRRSIQEVTREMEDTSVNAINEQMMAGKHGQATIFDDNGQKKYVFYAPVEGDMGWSMAVVCSDREIYKDLRTMGLRLTLLMIAGLALMTFIIIRTARSFKNLQEANAKNERIGSELRIANAIQMGMIPKMFPPYPERDDVEIFGSLMPAKEVGGDLYDFYIRDEKLFFCIGDVSGKGVPASLVMAVTRSMFRTVSAHESASHRIIQLMNESMTDMNDSNMFVTLFVGVLDLPTGRLRYSNAGHNAPLLVSSPYDPSPNTAEMLTVDSNIPLGVMGDWKYTLQETIVKPHTMIFLYTDGLTEAENLQNAQFGEERIMETAKNSHPLSPITFLEAMTENVRAFVDGAEQSDDLTMLAIQYTKEQRDVRLLRNLTLPNEIQAVPKLSAFVEEVCEAMNFDPTVTMQMNLAIEEAVVNVMNYAYPSGKQGEISVEAQANDVRLKFTICDTGIPFDPTVRAEVDTSLPLEERPIGGLGIHLVRQIMDSINYERVDGKNVLTLRKKLVSE